MTNSAEIAAFFVARGLVVAFLYVANAFLLSPLYMQLYRSGGVGTVTIVAWSVTLLSWLVTLLLFLALRGAFRGVPPMVAGRRNAVTSSGGEIGAFLLAGLIVVVINSLLTTLMLAGVYASLRQSGGASSVVVVSLTVAAVTAVVFFLIFIALRLAMAGAADGLYDDGGAPMGFGQAIAVCLRKYAVCSGRASRSEYWWWVLFHNLLYVVAMILLVLEYRAAGVALWLAVSLLLLLPAIAVTARRLHDIDMSGWWMLIALIPLIGTIAMLVWTCTRGTNGANRFGMGPASTAIPEVFA